jgi:large subunit ribosomal protein L5e
MVHVRDIKTPQYFKRFQVKYRRRREGKTDYRARLRLVVQDKNKYNTPKHRFVVRFTNKDIVCQVVYSTMSGDVVMCAAYAHELAKFDVTFGLTNYSAAYCVGLLCARRLLKKLGMDETYEGKTEIDGEDYHVEADGDARPFKCFLDTGLKRTSTGSKVFACLKGACDGGLDIPHNEKRFAGYDKDSKELDTETFQRYLTGGHVSEYMESLEEEEPEKYQECFKSYIEAEKGSDDLEEFYTGVHEKIRSDPMHVKKPRAKSDGKKWHAIKLTYDQKKANLKAKLNALRAADEEEEEEEDDEE